jgi:ketosteroid isomerase-like protein
MTRISLNFYKRLKGTFEMDFADEISQLKKRLTRLEEKESIKDVIYGYVYAVDTKNIEQTMTLFDDEIQLQYVQDEVRLDGKSEVRDFYQQIFARYDVLMHKIANIMIQTDGLEASGRSYWMVYEILKDGGGERWGEGYYHHGFVRTDGVWKIRDLTINARYFRVEKRDVLEVGF